MHGEYKVPGGKLVVVDLDVIDHRIANFRLAGDFFLEPDGALALINEAVNGLSEDSDASTISVAIPSCPASTSSARGATAAICSRCFGSTG